MGEMALFKEIGSVRFFLHGLVTGSYRWGWEKHVLVGNWRVGCR